MEENSVEDRNTLDHVDGRDILGQVDAIKQAEEEKARLLRNEDREAYLEAFSSFDWQNNGKISYGSLVYAMRRAGANPTEVEVNDITNKLDDGSGYITFDSFCSVMVEQNEELDLEVNYKETFRVFSKDFSGCISVDEFKFVFKHLGVIKQHTAESDLIKDLANTFGITLMLFNCTERAHMT